MIRTPIFALIVLLAGAPSARAACSNSTMIGSWGYRYTSLDFNLGTFCSGIGAIKFSSANRAQIIGGKVSCNGMLSSGSGSGTYSMASSCLGAITLVANNGATLKYHLTVTNGGKDVDFVLGMNGVTLSGSGKKQ